MVIFSSRAPFMLSSADSFFSAVEKMLQLMLHRYTWHFHAMKCCRHYVHHAKECAHNGCIFCKWYFMKTPHSKQHNVTYTVYTRTKCGHLQHYEFLHRHLFREYEWHPAEPVSTVCMHLSTLLTNWTGIVQPIFQFSGFAIIHEIWISVSSFHTMSELNIIHHT